MLYPARNTCLRLHWSFDLVLFWIEVSPHVVHVLISLLAIQQISRSISVPCAVYCVHLHATKVEKYYFSFSENCAVEFFLESRAKRHRRTLEEV